MFVFLLLVLLTVPASLRVVFEDCGSAYEIISVDILGCGARLPCFVTLGEKVPVNISFYADFLSREFDQDVTININLINKRTYVTPEQCQIVDCPVMTNAITSFTSMMSVPADMALNQRGYLRWRVINEFGQQVLCYSVLVQTQSPLQKILRRTMAYSEIYQNQLNYTNEIFISGRPVSHDGNSDR